VAALMLVPLNREPDRLVRALHDYAHFVVFTVFTAVTLGRERLDRRALIRLVAAIAALLILLEVLQPLMGRNGECGDLALGFAGVLAGLFLRGSMAPVPVVRRCIAWGGAVLLAVGCMVPAAGVLVDRWAASRDFPLLASFESVWEMGRWETRGCRLARSRDHVTHGRYALEAMVFDPVDYPGVTLLNQERDWRSASVLALDVTLDGRQQRLWIRVDDAVKAPYDARFQRTFDLGPGTHRLEIPLHEMTTPTGRPMNLAHIVSLSVFLDTAERGHHFWIDRVLLLPQG
jgi:hypothetical protein